MRQKLLAAPTPRAMNIFFFVSPFIDMNFQLNNILQMLEIFSIISFTFLIQKIFLTLMQNNQSKRPPDICKSLSRAFLQPQNTLILHSKGLDILPALAEALYIEQSHLTILIAFQSSQIQQLNHHLSQIKQQKLLMRDDHRSDKPQVYVLNKVVRQKRRKCYISGGIYALTLQIMLLDCMSQGNDLNVELIDRVIIRQGVGLGDGYGLVSLLATLLSLNKNKKVIRLINSHPQIFKGDNLQKIMRQLYLKKLVMWPFGRSQIHQSLELKPISNINHKLPMNALQSRIHQHLIDLLRYCQKSEYDKKQVQYLLSSLLNYGKLDFLQKFENIVKGNSQYGIWKSSNTNIIQLIDHIMKASKGAVFSLLLQSAHKNKQQNQNQEQQGQQEKIKREIDLTKLIPIETQGNSTKICSPVVYKLEYELYVDGLCQNDCENSPLFSSKLIQIIRSVKSECQGLHTCEKNDQVMRNEVEQMIEMAMRQRLQKIMQQSNGNHKNVQVENEILEKQIVRGQKQQGEEQYQMQREKDEKKNRQDQNKQLKYIDFQSYGFQKNMLNSRTKLNKKSSSQLQKSISQDNKIMQKQEEIMQKFSEQKQIIQPQFQTNQINSLQSKPIPQINNIQTTCNNFSQEAQNIHNFQPYISEAQRVIYISTDSPQLSKNIHQNIYLYQNKLHYIAYIRKLLTYLQSKQQQRIAAIKRVIKKSNNQGSKGNNIMLHLQHQPILLQELALELRSVYACIERYSLLKNDQQKQREELFAKQLERMNLRYVNKRQLKLWVLDYSRLDDCFILIKGIPNIKVRFCIQCSQSIPQLNQNLRILLPHSIYFYSPKTALLRHLNILYSQEQMFGVQAIHTVYFNNSIQALNVIKKVKEQDEAFWGIAQQRKKLGEYSENPEARIKELIIDDEIHKKARMLRLAAETQAKNARNQLPIIKCMENFKVERTVLVDKRQFKSLLPSYLFHFGFRVIPVFLEHADYILSNDIGIEKKSVHTRDLHESLRCGRLSQQLKYLSIKFTKPYLLIECPDISHFRKEQFAYSMSKVTGQKYSFNVRKQLVSVINKYPKVNLIWSTSYLQTIKYFIELKKNKEQPNICKFKPQNQQNQLETLQQQNQEEKSQKQYTMF